MRVTLSKDPHAPKSAGAADAECACAHLRAEAMAGLYPFNASRAFVLNHDGPVSAWAAEQTQNVCHSDDNGGVNLE